MISTAILKLIKLGKITVGMGTCFCEKKSIDVIHEYFDKKDSKLRGKRKGKAAVLLTFFIIVGP